MWSAKEIEFRKERRVNLEAPLIIQRFGPEGALTSREELTAKNISLGGVYFETNREGVYAPNERLIASLSIAEVHRRTFPFTRLTGPAQVVRVTTVASDEKGSAAGIGVALEFGRDLTALTTTPLRS